MKTTITLHFPNGTTSSHCLQRFLDGIIVLDDIQVDPTLRLNDVLLALGRRHHLEVECKEADWRTLHDATDTEQHIDLHPLTVLPTDEAAVAELEATAFGTYHALLRLINLLYTRAAKDEWTDKAILSVRRAIWAVQDVSYYKMRALIRAGDEPSAQTLTQGLRLFREIAAEANREVDLLQSFPVLTLSLVLAVGAVGETVTNTFYRTSAF